VRGQPPPLTVPVPLPFEPPPDPEPLELMPDPEPLFCDPVPWEAPVCVSPLDDPLPPAEPESCELVTGGGLERLGREGVVGRTGVATWRGGVLVGAVVSVWLKVDPLCPVDAAVCLRT
jgi:hypothetical protein